MKPSRKLLLVLAGATALGAVSSGAQDWQNKLYGKFDAGGCWVQDTEVTEVFGPAVPSATMKFDVGVRSGVGVGYNVTDWFAGELELGMMANGVKELSGASSVEATLWNLPLLVNAKLQWPNRSIFTPYIGAGVGGSSALMDIDHLDYGYTHLSGTASAFVFSYQAFAGVHVAINDHMSLGAEYRYVHADAPDFEIDWGSYWYIYSDNMKVGAIDTQSVSLIFQISF